MLLEECDFRVCYTEWSGINALLYYGPLLMRSLGFNGSTVNLMVAGGVNIVQFLAVLPAILYIDRWGKWFAQLDPDISLSYA